MTHHTTPTTDRTATGPTTPTTTPASGRSATPTTTPASGRSATPTTTPASGRSVTPTTGRVVTPMTAGRRRVHACQPVFTARRTPDGIGHHPPDPDGDQSPRGQRESTRGTARQAVTGDPRRLARSGHAGGHVGGHPDTTGVTA